MNYVIIGNGVAGMNAAIKLRQRDDSAKITIISSESDHFFSRTALMYVVAGQLSERCVEPYERDHYARMKFERVRDRVSSINPMTRMVHLENSNPINFDRLLIASGSLGVKAPWTGGELDGVGNFVTWQDMEWLQAEMKSAQSAVVVGGGLIGIEVAEVLLQAGIKVNMLVREDWFWPIALSNDESKIIVPHMESHGCTVQLKSSVKEIIGQAGRVQKVITEAGQEIDCDLFVTTIGVTPQTGFLANCGFELDERGGIVVDDQLFTGVPDIWAAGDCTSVVWFNGVRRPEQLWYTSRDQGRVAGLNMAGDKRIYKRETFYNSAKFFDIEYTTAGYVNFNFDGEESWFHKEPDSNRSIRITYMPDRTVVGFNMLGRRWDHRLLVGWVDEKRTLDWVKRHLTEALFDEEFMPKLELAV